MTKLSTEIEEGLGYLQNLSGETARWELSVIETCFTAQAQLDTS